MTLTEKLLNHDRFVIAAGLALLTILSWVWVMAGAGTGMSTIAMTTFQFPPPAMDGVAMQWTPLYALIMLAMWWVMMIAMMVPSASPMVLLYGRVARHAQRHGQMPQGGSLPAFSFISGYLIAWLCFSVAATLLQWGLEQAGLVHQMLMWSTNSTLTGVLLVTAGIFQLTPLKTACLEHCRSPAGHLSRNWRDGHSGALRMGLVHGTYCLGCCWALMALLFAGGVMNLVWIAALTIVVLLEKLAPWGKQFGRALAVIMAGTGAWLLILN